MGITGDTAAVLAAAAKYTIIKAGDGVTVGLHLPDGRYVEGRSDAGDVSDAVRRAFAGRLPVPARGRLSAGAAPDKETRVRLNGRSTLCRT